jgi:hypothetical protein
VTESISLALLALITAVLGSLSFPLDAGAQVAMGVIVFVPAIVFFAMIARARLVTLHRKFSLSTARRRSTSSTRAGKTASSSSEIEQVGQFKRPAPSSAAITNEA